MAFRERRKKDIYPQGNPWKKVGLGALAAIAALVWFATRDPKRPHPPHKPPPRSAPRTAPPVGQPKEAKGTDPSVSPSGGHLPNGPSSPTTFSPDFSRPGQETRAVDRNGRPVSPKEKDDQWLARWFPSLFQEADSGSGGSAGSSFSGFSVPPGLTDSAFSPASSGDASPPNFGMRSPSELVGGGGTGGGGTGGGGPGTGGTTPPVFIDDTYREKNIEIINQFKGTARLEIPLIPGTQYTLLDLDAGFEGVNIFNSLDGTNVSIVARAGTVTQAELELFLQEGDTGIPALNGVVAPASLGVPNTIPAPAGAGLKDAQGWQFNSNGRTVQLALMERADGQGTYLFVVNSATGSVENAEDFYSVYFDQLKAL